MFGAENRMSPDDHYTDLKRIIAAIGGKAKKITVVMLYFTAADSIDVTRASRSTALRCSENSRSWAYPTLSRSNAHDPRVQNAIPLVGFDNFMPTYQILKALLRRFPIVSR